MKYGQLISIFFPITPILLMFVIPRLRKQSQKIYWVTLLGFSLCFLLFTLIVFQEGKPILNGPLSQLIGFILGPTTICFILSRIDLLWKKTIIGIICIPVFYFFGWVLFINIGMLLGVLLP